LRPQRWKTCIGQTDGALGFALSRLYVDAVFTGESKVRAFNIHFDTCLTAFVRFRLIP